MVKPIKSILLATNLKEYNKIAFDYAASTAVFYGAKLVLIHVIEKTMEQIEARIVWMLGKEQRKEDYDARERSVRQTLVGKDITNAIIRESMLSYSKKIATDDVSNSIPSREVVVVEGNVVEEILNCSKEHDCGMIIMAAHEGLFSKSSLSGILKGVLKNSSVPVVIVPHVFEK